MPDTTNSNEATRLRQSNSRMLGVSLYLFAWAVIAVVASTTSYIAVGGSSAERWLEIFGIMLEYFFIWAGIAFGIYWLQRQLTTRS